MDDMSGDYEDMRRAREEAKKQLDAKFQDVYSKIKETRDFVTSEGKRVNEVLRNFQTKFEQELKELKDYTVDTFEKERQARETAEAEANARMDQLH